MAIGFSTGSIAYSNFAVAVDLLNQVDTNAVELSALREHELQPLQQAIGDLDLLQFEYISIHAPSKIVNLQEEAVVAILSEMTAPGWHVIVHPDIITNYDLWKVLGNRLCIENMDKRKPCGRTVTDLRYIFGQLPEATFCLDLAHAKQVDPTMTECYLMIKEFRNKIAQLHVSDVTSDSRHVPLNMEAIIAYQKMIKYLPANIPVILESPILPGDGHVDRVRKELEVAAGIFMQQEMLLA